MLSVPTTDLAPDSRMVLACLRDQPDQDTARSMAEGALAQALGYEEIRGALGKLRDEGLAREASGRWHLTRLGYERRDEEPGPRVRCRVTCEIRGTVASVTVTGNVRKSDALHLRDELQRAAENDPEIVLLDLSGVRQLAPEGVEAIADADGRGRRGGARLVVMPGPERVQAAIARAGLVERLTFVAGRALAV